MEVGGRGRGGLYTYRYTVTTRMIPALRWAAMRAILMFQSEVMDKVTRHCPTNHNLFEEKGEPKRYRTAVLPLTSLQLQGTVTRPLTASWNSGRRMGRGTS